MANLNKVMLIGRLTRDPEVRTFFTGGKVAKFGFAVNNRRKNATTGEWEDEPVFLDIEAFNRGESGRQLADLVSQYLHKGNQAFVEGHLRLDQWTAQDGQKRSKLKIVMDNVQFLEKRADGGSDGGGYQRSPSQGMAAPPARPIGEFEEPPPEPEFAPQEAQGDHDIPF